MYSSSTFPRSSYATFSAPRLMISSNCWRASLLCIHPAGVIAHRHYRWRISGDYFDNLFIKIIYIFITEMYLFFNTRYYGFIYCSNMQIYITAYPREITKKRCTNVNPQRDLFIMNSVRGALSWLRDCAFRMI